MKKLFFMVLFFSFPIFSWAAYGDTTTYLGKIYSDNENAKNAYLDFAEDLTYDQSGNMYIADTYNNVIRKINASGNISTLVGTGSYGDKNGINSEAELAIPKGIAVGDDGAVYIADTFNHKIKKVFNNNIITLVDNNLSYPEGVIVLGSTVFIADTGNNAIKKVSTSGGVVATVNNSVKSPKKLIFDVSGEYLYVTAAGSHRIVKIEVDSGAESIVAGSGLAEFSDGAGMSASFDELVGITLDTSANNLYVTDSYGYKSMIRRIDLTNNDVVTIADDSAMATLSGPKGITLFNNYLYVASGIGTIQRFNKDTGDTDTEDDRIAGKNRFNHEFGSKDNSLIGRPNDLVMSPDGKYIYLAENNFIRKIKVSDGSTSHLIGSVVDAYREGDDHRVRFSNITGITIDSSGKNLYVADRWNNRIRKVNITNAEASLVAGGGETDCHESCNGYKEGTGSGAKFDIPGGIVISPDDEYLYVSDTGNNRIRKIKISTGKTSLVAGSGSAGFADETGSTAKFNRPFGIDIDSSGKYLYVADSNGHRIRRVEISTSKVTTVAGNGNNGYQDAIGTTAVLSYPEYVKVGADGNLYFTEVGSHLVKYINIDTRSVRTITGTLNRGFKNGASNVTRFNNPKGLLPDTINSKLYIADNWNDLIREVSLEGDEPPFLEEAPAPTSISPKDRYTQATSSDQTIYLNINGSNFSHGATSMFGSLASVKTLVNSDNKLTVEIPFGQMSPAYYDVKVSNVDGQYGVCEKCFIVLNSDGSLPPDYQVEESQVDFDAYDARLRGGYHIYSGNVIGGALSPTEIITGTSEGFGPQISIFDGNGNVVNRFFAYAEHLRSGVRVATCDLDMDGTDEIVTAPGSGGRPHIRIFNAEGEPTVHPGFFALDGKFQGGANLGCGDVNLDGRAEIIVAASPGGGPHFTVHNYKGELVASHMAYDENFRGGIKLATADFNNDNRYEILTAPELGAPHVQMFNTLENEVVRLNPGFYAFHPDFRGGLSVAGGDVDGDDEEEIIVSQRTNGQAWVKVYRGQDQSIMKTFLAYPASHTGGAVVAAGDTDGDGKDEIMTMPGSDGSPQVRVFDIE